MCVCVCVCVYVCVSPGHAVFISSPLSSSTPGARPFGVTTATSCPSRALPHAAGPDVVSDSPLGLPVRQKGRRSQPPRPLKHTHIHTEMQTHTPIHSSHTHTQQTCTHTNLKMNLYKSPQCRVMVIAMIKERMV